MGIAFMSCSACSNRGAKTSESESSTEGKKEFSTEEKISFVWIIEPSLKYTDIRYFPALGYIGYTETSMFYIDQSTGKVIQETEPTGGFGPPYIYGYDIESAMFYNNLEYEYYIEDIEEVIKKSKNTTLSVYEFKLNEDGENSIENAKYAVYRNGVFLSKFIYDNVIGGNSVAFVQKNGKYAIFGSKGELLTDFIYDAVCENAVCYVAAKNGDYWGFLDLNGNEILPFMFENIVNTNKSYAFVKYNGKYGILDINKTANEMNN